MSGRDQIEALPVEADAPEMPIAPPCCARWSKARSGQARPLTTSIDGRRHGELLAIATMARRRSSSFRASPAPPRLRAKTVVDLHGAHIGAQVVLMFEQRRPAAADRAWACCAGTRGWPLDDARPGGSGRRRRADDRQRQGATGAALRQGEHHADQGRQGADRGRLRAVSRSTGVNRIKGGSVQLN